jgi:hypothetical protein
MNGLDFNERLRAFVKYVEAERVDVVMVRWGLGFRV